MTVLDLDIFPFPEGNTAECIRRAFVSAALFTLVGFLCEALGDAIALVSRPLTLLLSSSKCSP